jgi:hypothetical protein
MLTDSAVLSGSGSRSARIQTSCARVAAPTFDRGADPQPVHRDQPTGRS